jgi:transposase-like protein
LWIDASYVKVRQNGCIVSVAVIVAVGVNSDGRREVLGIDIGPSEAETFYATGRDLEIGAALCRSGILTGTQTWLKS